ncbi:hypothetical protein [Pseudonocardia charpentierae]|uniref:Uncharacterized protein n=1 Tax=Pseudonocardia charpentierae TaxID=3075545 RepID=A0ABU2N262_9PSEU|nr:hypothetical protein [Pseudonocardia sp. DSM 45834]MDT0348002.1 hypothetical protein [Pseudonocardia sp. DSM 45834]
MSSTFFITLVVALVAVFCWRVVVMVAIAVLLAFVLTGISTVSGALAGQQGDRPVVVAPGAPGAPIQQPGGPAPDPGSQDDGPNGEPRVQEQDPPR